MLMLFISIKDNKGKLLDTIECGQKSCTLGKSGKNFIKLKGWRIAGTHAEIIQNDNGVYVSDLSEGVGTLVNGEEVTTFGPLSANDEIVISSYRVSVTTDQPGKKNPTPQAETASEVFAPEKNPEKTAVVEEKASVPRDASMTN